MLDTQLLGQRPDHLDEPARDQTDSETEILQRGDERPRAGGEPDRLPHLVEDRRGQPAQRGDPLVQRLAEIDLTAHGGGSDRSHLRLPPGVGGQQLDHLVADQRGVDVHHDQPATLPGQPGGRDRHVETRLGGGLRKRRTQVCHIGMRNPEFDGGHRLPGQPAAAVDVAAVVGDHLGRRGHVPGQQRASQQRDHHSLGTRRVVAHALRDVQGQPEPGAGTGQPVGQFRDVGGQRAAEQQRENELLPNNHLLEVEHFGTGAGDRVHQLHRHARPVDTGDGGREGLQTGTRSCGPAGRRADLAGHAGGLRPGR